MQQWWRQKRLSYHLQLWTASSSLYPCLNASVRVWSNFVTQLRISTPWNPETSPFFKLFSKSTKLSHSNSPSWILRSIRDSRTHFWCYYNISDIVGLSTVQKSHEESQNPDQCFLFNRNSSPNRSLSTLKTKINFHVFLVSPAYPTK